MAGPLETEIKLAASPARLEALRTHPALGVAATAQLIANTYFDTPDGALRRAGGTLRLRATAGKAEQTLKLPVTAAAAPGQHEWNVALSGKKLDLARFPAAARSALGKLPGGREIAPIARSRIEREVREVRQGSALVEVSFDSGSIEAGGRAEPVCELELELREGGVSDLYDLALLLPLGADLIWVSASKGHRASALAVNQPPSAAHAQPIRFPRAVTVATGFHAIAWNCLSQLLANYPIIAGPDSPEAIHQARVAIRRLRSAIKLFSGVLDKEAAAVIGAELKAAGRLLGKVRDLDTLILLIQSAAPPGDDGPKLLHLFASRRKDALKAAQVVLTGASFQQFLFHLAGWIEDSERQIAAATQDVQFAELAAAWLKKRARKIWRRGKYLAKLGDPVRHKLRIKVKTLRYGANFFGSLFGGAGAGKAQARFSKACSRLQDSLGELHDIAVAHAGHADLFTNIDPIEAAALQAELSTWLAAAHRSRKQLIDTSEKSLRRLHEAAGWWTLS